MRLRLGPLPADDALVWTADTLELFDALDGDPRLPFSLPVEALIEMRAVVSAMQARASAGRSFVWQCETTLDDLKTLITYWLNIGKLSEHTLEAIGGRYSGEAGERFHAVLLASLLEQLAAVEPAYAARLREGWSRQATAPTELLDLRSGTDAPATAAAP